MQGDRLGRTRQTVLDGPSPDDASGQADHGEDVTVVVGPHLDDVRLLHLVYHRPTDLPEPAGWGTTGAAAGGTRSRA